MNHDFERAKHNFLYFEKDVFYYVFQILWSYFEEIIYDYRSVFYR